MNNKKRKTKIRVNDPCFCKSGKKYKKCCMLKENTNFTEIKSFPIFTKKDFISGPYINCPNCSQESFGLPLMGISHDKYKKECYKCGHIQSYPLPKIKKKIIYLDQFAIANMVKALDPKHPKHQVVIKDPFWINMYQKLDMLSKAHLIVCPDSFYHIDESSPTDYFDSMQRIYEHLSGGVTFYMESQIMNAQITEHFLNYLSGNPDIPLIIDPEKIVFGNLNEWHNKMRISVTSKRTKENIEEKQKENILSYERFKDVFKRWQTEKHRKFEDFYKEEVSGFSKGTLIATRNFYERKLNMPAKYIETGKVDINDVIPPAPVELINDLINIAIQNGSNNSQVALIEVTSYLNSPKIEHIPTLRIGASIYAALASQAANGRTKLPSPGVKTDVEMISSLLPYCDAMLIDKENANILNDGRVRKKVDFPTKIFAPKDRVAFLQYLDDIFIYADHQHIDKVKEIYGPDSIKAYTTILNDHNKNSK